MSLAGRLLVATPILRDPNFARTVVMLLAQGDDGALGVVLNRPSELSLAEVLPQWASLAEGLPIIFAGGPVAPEAAICLAQIREGGAPEGWAPVDRRLGTADLSGDPDALAPYVERLRIFAGYAGWGAGQLETEIEQGAWFVFDMLPGDPFTAEPARLWPTVLRRQGGLLAAVAYFPADPTLN